MPNDPENTEKSTKATDENTTSTDNNEESQQKLLKTLKELTKARKESTEELIKRINYETNLAAMTNDRMAQQKAFNELIKESKKLAEEDAAALNMSAEEHEARKNAVGAQIEAMKKLGLTYEEITPSTEKFAKASDDLFSDLATKSAIFGDTNKGIVGQMFKFAAAMEQDDNALKTMSNSFRKYFNLTSLATGLVQNLVQSTIAMVKSFDDASASFAKATGTGDQFAGMMIEMRQEGNALGVTFENSAAALQALIENQVGFLHSSKAAQKEMATQVALMERIGISADVSAEMMNVFTINMGQSQQSAIKMTKALASMGSVLGNSQKFLKDFQESLKTLAVYGDGAVEVFSNMAAAARAAGVEVSTLTGLASKFDTFSEAADTVGKLNALLGSQLSSTEMLLMTEDKRIETLIQQVQISGQSFSDMNKFQQMAIANAAGITDMNEAQRIFGMSMKDYNRYQKDMERQAKLQENFNKAIEATIPLQEKVKQFFAEFAIWVKPTLDGLSVIIGGLTDIMSKAPESAKALMGFVTVGFLLKKAFGGIALIKGSIAAIGASSKIAGAGLKTVSMTAGPTSKGLRSLGASAASAAGGMAAFALPFIGIVGSIGLLVVGMGYLVDKLIALATFGGDAILVIYGLSGALASLAAAGVAGFFGSAGIWLMMDTLATGLSKLKAAIQSDTSAVSNALENLALIATGTSAKAMGGVAANISTELKGAVEAALTTKLEIELKINEGKFNSIIEDVVGEYINGKGQRQIVKIARGEI